MVAIFDERKIMEAYTKDVRRQGMELGYEIGYRVGYIAGYTQKYERYCPEDDRD